MLTNVDEQAAETALRSEKELPKARLRPIENVAAKLTADAGLGDMPDADIYFWMVVEHLASVRVRDARSKARRAGKAKKARDANTVEACDRCPKPVMAGELVARSELGLLRLDGEFSERYGLGYMHVDCYKAAAKFRELNIASRISKARSTK